MDLRKYSVSEFSEMLENEMKLNKEKCEKIAKYYEMKRDIKNDLEITYKIVAPVEKNVYYRRPLEMAYNYDFRNIAFLVYICYNASRQWNKYLHIQRKPQRVAFSGVFYSVKWFNLLGWLPYSSPSSHLQI